MNQFCEGTQGTAMDLSLSSALANIYMEALEKKVQESVALNLKCWFRYIYHLTSRIEHIRISELHQWNTSDQQLYHRAERKRS